MFGPLLKKGAWLLVFTLSLSFCLLEFVLTLLFVCVLSSFVAVVPVEHVVVPKELRQYFADLVLSSSW